MQRTVVNCCECLPWYIQTLWQSLCLEKPAYAAAFHSHVQVLSHPQFQADPISAIAHHLNANLPPVPEAPKPKADPLMRKQQKARKKWEKKLQKNLQGMVEDSD